MNKNIIIGVLLVGLIAAGVVGYQHAQAKNNFRNSLENTYQNDFQSMLTYIKNLEADLSKATVSSSNAMSTELLTNIWRQSDLAATHLSRIPLEHSTLKDSEAFLNKLGDFCYAMAKIHMQGQDLNEEQRKDLVRMRNGTSFLLQQLEIMNEDVMRGEVKFATGNLNGSDEELKEVTENLVTKGFTSVQKEMADYPKLIYDGPFSDHIQDIEPKWIKGDDITEEEGIKRVEEYLGKDNIEGIRSNGKVEGVIEAFVYDVSLKDQEENAYVEITEKGGHILKVMTNRVPQEQNISIEDARGKAEEYLKNKKYESLEVTYHEKYSNVGVFNFAHIEEDNIICYPDLIKVQVALDDGEVIGIEAQGYHYSHHERDLPEPKISQEEAKEQIIDGFEMTSERLAVIPTEFKTEKLCYEFKGTLNHRWFIIYIDAETGEEVQILQIIEADESVLTI